MAHRISKQKKEIVGLNAKELAGKASEVENHLFQLRMQQKTGQLASPAMIGIARKELARIKTALAQKANA